MKIYKIIKKKLIILKINMKILQKKKKLMS